MKKSIVVLVAVSMFAIVAAAQDVPTAEAFLGFTYTRVNSASNVPAFSANGGTGQFAYNIGRWVSVVADLGAVHNGNISGYNLDTTLTNFMLGPRINLRYSRVKPYFQTLFGGVYGSTSTMVQVPVGTPTNPIVIPPPVAPTPYASTGTAGNWISLRAATQQTAFAMAIGGGLDIKVNKWMSFRPIELDYYMMRLQNLRTSNDNNQHNLRYMTGFNFTFDAQ